MGMYSVCVCNDGVGVTTYDDTTKDADTTVIAAVIGGSIGGLVIVMVVIVGVMIAVVLNMRKKQLKHGKCYRSTLYSSLLMYWIYYLLQVVETPLMMLQM